MKQQMSTNPNLDADCSAVQNFIANNSNPSIELVLSEVPNLAECLSTHNLIPNAPTTTLKFDIAGLRALGLNLFEADISGKGIVDSRLRGANFTGAQASNFMASNTDFIGCYFHGADFMNSVFKNCRFIGCEISKNDFREAKFINSEFTNCDIYANWAKGARLPLDDFSSEAFGFGEKSPWDEGFCDGHQINS